MKNKNLNFKTLAYIFLFAAFLGTNTFALNKIKNSHEAGQTLLAMLPVAEAECEGDCGATNHNHLTDVDPCDYTCTETITVLGVEVSVDWTQPGELVECHANPDNCCTPHACEVTDPCTRPGN